MGISVTVDGISGYTRNFHSAAQTVYEAPPDMPWQVVANGETIVEQCSSGSGERRERGSTGSMALSASLC